eukprot:5053576-Karenia_brevis.AAC.1
MEVYPTLRPRSITVVTSSAMSSTQSMQFYLNIFTYAGGNMAEAMPGYVSCKLCFETHRSHHVMALHIIQEHTGWDILEIDSLYDREEYMESRAPFYGQLDRYTTKSAPHAPRNAFC